jgi:hypothetical protein
MRKEMENRFGYNITVRCTSDHISDPGAINITVLRT